MYFYKNKVTRIFFLKWVEWNAVIDGNGNENEWLDGTSWGNISVFQISGDKRFILNLIWSEVLII